jgi:hypothetical protein
MERKGVSRAKHKWKGFETEVSLECQGRTRSMWLSRMGKEESSRR